MKNFKFFKTTFGKIFTAVTLTIIGILVIVGFSTFSQVNKGFNEFVDEQQRFLEGKGIWEKMTAIENVREFQSITNNFKGSLIQSIIFSSAIGLTAGVFISILISEQITKPLKNLKEIVKNVAKNDYDTRAKVEGSEEIKDLIQEFNSLIDELDRIEQLREDLVTDVAHELKTPLTKVRGQLEGVIDGVYSLDNENLKKVLKNVDQLEYLIERLQELIQVKAGKERLKKENINVQDVVNDVISGFTGKDITMVLNISSDLKIEADERKFKEVLDNLIGNAYKYTKKGKITISADEKSLTVSDTGCGIPEKDLPYIFERFYRVDKSRNKETGGFGLGLSIVKEIVDAHNWKITVTSEVGKGSTFKIDF